ncbi:hypothetical protein SAMN04487864_10191 [Succiniclasticum ruminis]|uniref:O-antigen ligase like membrane protein n=1 Tax=Succiniclasticum ruminis TaxID=40841 RepID=A0A1G6HMM6_9FIRM|nr:hypothetical protein [Succiniclasticum ruminis]SDB95368.1 hypothetical protein SAMN04487864_10191 [Succiniclasticum ruminis]
MKIKIVNFEKAIFILFIASIVLNYSTYFTWDSYGNVFIKYAIKSFRYFGLLIMFLYLMTKRNGLNLRKLNSKLFLLTCILIFNIIEMNLLGASHFHFFYLGPIVILSTFIICLSLSVVKRSNLYEYFMKLFVLVTLPSVIYYLLVYVVGINLPYTVLGSDHMGKVAGGLFYQLRPLGIIADSVFNIVPRLCGIFDEPGVVGTFCAFFISINLLCNINRKWTCLLFLEGVASLSFAFYILLFLLVLIVAFNKGAVKFLTLMLVFLASLMIFVNAEFTNPQLTALQKRIDFTSNILIVDNRTSTTFDKAFDEFISKGGYPLIFGEGIGAYNDNPNMTGSNSYKCLIYDYGIVGFVLYVGFFVLLYIIEYGINRYNLPFFILFMASLYQRAYILDQMYLALYICGLAYITLNKDMAMFSNKIIVKDNGDKYASC